MRIGIAKERRPDEHRVAASPDTVKRLTGMGHALTVETGAGAIVLALGVLYAPVYGPEAALFCELFDTRVRYSGISVVYQVSGIVSSSITPLIATTLLHANDNQPWYIASYILVIGLISAISTYFMRRTF